MRSDVSFQLETAAWPALVVEAGGTIRHANQAAIALFGPKLEGEGISLSALWADPSTPLEQFISHWERSPVAVHALKFRGKGGSVVTFSTYICSTRDAQKRYLFQLIQELPASPPAHGATPGPATATAASRPISSLSDLGISDNSKPVPGETALFHRQKLDRALQLSRSVTLDFNNALTSILGHTSFVLSHMEQDHAWRSSLIEVQKGAEKAAEIARQLASFSRPEKEPAEHASGNLNSVIRRTVEAFQKSSSPTIQWPLELERRLYAVKIDEGKIQQTLARILTNAIEAVGEVGRISVTSRNLDISEPTHDLTAHLLPGPYVSVTVTDDGKGIDPSFLPRIFEPFFSTKHGHRGLGLTWVYGILTNHRGGVAVSSPPGQGTSVRIYLPATQKIVADTSVLNAEPPGRHTVLMVDDEDPLLTLAKTILTSVGYEVITANSGAQALQRIAEAKSPIDLVITDLVMPQMSGLELIEQVQLRLPGVPCLCTSGCLGPGTNLAEEGFLPKPFTSQELVHRVRERLKAAEDI